MRKVLFIIIITMPLVVVSQKSKEVENWIMSKSLKALVSNDNMIQTLQFNPDDEFIKYFTDEVFDKKQKEKLVLYGLYSEVLHNLFLFDLRGIKSVKYIKGKGNSDEANKLIIELGERFYCKNLLKIAGVKRVNKSRTIIMFLKSDTDNIKLMESFIFLGKANGFKVENLTKN